MKAVKQDAASIAQERDNWYHEAIAAQEMLAQVLIKVGEPVEVPKRTPLPEGVGILIDDDQENNVFRFRLAMVDDEGNELGPYEPTE